jgi:cytochrome c peroxidase
MVRGGDETSSNGIRMTKTICAINANRLIMKLSTRSIHKPNNFTCFRQIVAHPGGLTRAFARHYLINWKLLGQAICRAVFSTTATVRIFGLLLGASATSAQEPIIDTSAVRSNALRVLTPLSNKMPGAEHDCAALVSLGKNLYFEKRLSVNRSQSCNTCHPVDNGQPGVDNQATSLGALGKRGGRHAPTTLNAGFQFAQFWDGRADNLTEQAKGPILNHMEMAMTSDTEAVDRLKGDQEYPRRFAHAFPGQKDPLTFENAALAIAAFERTLITHDRLDDFLKGQDSALTSTEVKGLNTFLTIGCTTCHNGPLLGGNSYRKIGIIAPYANQNDIGRAAVTKHDGDKFQFKVPTLRNVALTGPYFHDGSTVTLQETVRTMARLQLGLQLSDAQEQDLVTFLRCLTGRGITSHVSIEPTSLSTTALARESR